MIINCVSVTGDEVKVLFGVGDLFYSCVEMSDVSEIKGADVSGCVDPSSYKVFVNLLVEVGLCDVLLYGVNVFVSVACVRDVDLHKECE